MTTFEFKAEIKRVAIVQSQRIFAEALCNVLNGSGSLTVVGLTPTVPADAFASIRPDVILIDADDAGLDLPDAIVRCRTVRADVKICALSSHLRPEMMQRCMDAAADGYVVKDASPEELVRAITVIAEGMTYVDARIAGSIVRWRADGSRRPRRSDDLSVRETGVLRLIAQGCSNREISERLYLSEKTVKNHVSRILAKINATSRTHAAVQAIRLGIDRVNGPPS
jgi:DNA-binding NarL/FixJ family response regulator